MDFAAAGAARNTEAFECAIQLIRKPPHELERPHAEDGAWAEREHGGRERTAPSHPAASLPLLLGLHPARSLTGCLAGLHLLSALLPTLLPGLLPALLPSGLVLISLVIYICHKNISPSISIRFIDCSYGGALRHPLPGNDCFRSEDRCSAHEVKIYDSFSGARFPFSLFAQNSDFGDQA